MHLTQPPFPHSVTSAPYATPAVSESKALGFSFSGEETLLQVSAR